MTTLAQLRSARLNAIEKLKTGFNFEVTKERKSYDDSNMFKMNPDKAGIASATLRFLPRLDGELPIVKVHSHVIKDGNGKWHITRCLKDIGETCPMCNEYFTQWKAADGCKEKQAHAKLYKVKDNFVAKVYVISNPSNIEQNGQVLDYKFGKKIFEKIGNVLNPTFNDDEPINLFDLWSGVDFKLRQVEKDGFANFDNSKFNEQPSQLLGGDEDELIKIVDKITDLKADYFSKDKFKTVEQCKELVEKIESTFQKNDALDFLKSNVQTNITLESND